MLRVALWLPLLALCACGQEWGRGTSVVVVRSPREVYLAADSLEIVRTYDGDSEERRRTVCKVTRLGEGFAAIAGLAHGPRQFDALEEVRAAYTPGAALWQIAAVLRDRVGRSLQEAAQNLPLPPVLLQVALTAVENHAPVVMTMDFFRDADGEPVRESRCPGDCAGAYNAFLLGEHTALDRILHLDRTAIQHPDVQRVISLIDVEYRDRPDLIGGPVTLVRAGRKAEVLRGGACALE